MTHERSGDDPASATDARGSATTVAVTVVRSGGFAGLTRRWGVRAPAPEADAWIELVEDCPWGAVADRAAASGAPHGADRFSWSVRATVRGDALRAELAEAEVAGAWRTLIDAVRAASDAAV